MRDKIEIEEKESIGRRLAWKMHELNVQWPWLKILLMMAVITGVTVGVVGVMHGDAGSTTDEVQVSENGGGGQDGPDDVTEEKEKVDEEKPAEEPAKESEPEPKEAQATEVPASVEPAIQNTGRKIIALTFDDGPSTATTARLLDILAAKQVKVTFFVLGTMAQRAPDIVKREVAEGHEVESHTLSHLNLTNLTAEQVRGEVGGVDVILQEIIGGPAKLVRPPYGAINGVVSANVGKPMITWTVDPEDWKYRNAATVQTNVVSTAFDGAVVLLHDIHSSTVDAIPGIIDSLRAAGYEFLTVSEMAAERGVMLQNGYSYGSFRRY